MLAPSPRGPFGGLLGFSMEYRAALAEAVSHKPVLPFPVDAFDSIEKPEYYADGYHLNAKGRQKFTELMVTQVIRELQSPGLARRDFK